MSNKIFIRPTKFTDITNGTETLGVRVYDDFGCEYVNTWETIPTDRLDILDDCMAEDNLSDFIREAIASQNPNNDDIVLEIAGWMYAYGDIKQFVG